MTSTNFIFVSNIVKSSKSILLKEINNKWARIIFLDNPNSKYNDAIIYNPTTNSGHFDHCVENLRQIELECEPFEVFYVWFIPPGIFQTTMIPKGSILLPYIIIDHIPKDEDPLELFGVLPLDENDIKQWDISYKEDKTIILRIMPSYDETTRNFLLSYIRSKKLSNHMYPRALEMIISEESRLSKTMVPKDSKYLTPLKSHRSNFLYFYDLPARLGGQYITDCFKNLDIGSLRVYLIDNIEEMKIGFLMFPKSDEDDNYNHIVVKIRQSSMKFNSENGIALKFVETWLQPNNCLPPEIENIKFSGKDETSEMILSNYLYLYNISSNVTSADITRRSPYPFRLHLCSSSSSSNILSPSSSSSTALSTGSVDNKQIGFVILQEWHQWKINKIISYLRSLVFDSQQVFVDELWMKYSTEHTHTLPFPLSRCVIDQTARIQNKGLDCLDKISMKDCATIPKIILAKKPPITYLMSKTFFLFLMNIVDKVTGFTLNDDLNKYMEGFTTFGFSKEKIGFLKVKHTSELKWLNLIDLLLHNNTGLIIKEVYLQDEETLDLIQSKLPGIFLSNYILIHNICSSSADYFTEIEEHINKAQHKILSISNVNINCTSSAIRYIVVKLRPDISPQEILDCLSYLRSIKVAYCPIKAQLVWLGNITLDNTGC